MFRAVRLRLLVAFGLVLLSVLSVAGYALIASDEAPAEAEEAQGPQVVRELTEQRRVYSSTYLLDNGQFKTLMTTVPIHYQDANGDWQDVDLTLTPAAEGRLEVAKAPVAVTFANEAEGSPAVTLTNADGVLSLDLLEASEDEGAAEARGVRFAGVLPEVDLSYESLGDGLKQTLTLASAAAPASYSFRLSHPGFTMKQGENGQWGLYLAKAEEPSYLLSGLTVFDSAKDEAGVPVFCNDARLLVTPEKEASTVTYRLPRAWLDDPARVYPVQIDPTLTVPSPTDTFIASGYPTTSYGSYDYLYCGKVSVPSGTSKTLIKFPQVNDDIPFLAHVASATLKVRQYWQPTTNNDTTHFYRVGDSSTDWTESSTWNTVTLTDNVLIKDVNLAGTTWFEQACVAPVQHWVNSQSSNRGFLIAQTSSEDASYARMFRANEYTNPDYRPELTVVWEEPSTTITLDKTSATVGETVNATVNIGNVNIASQITELKLAINRNDGDTSRRRGILGWFKEPPAAEGWVYQTAHTPTNASYGYFAYYASSAYNSDKVTPLLDDCVISDNQHRAITFAFAPDEDWGSPDDNLFDTRIGMIASNVNWTSYWVAKTSPSFNVTENAGTPKALGSVNATTTASSGWFSGTTNNSSTQGRGGVTLSWPAVPLADTYKVLLWDGVKYNQLASTGNTSYTIATNIFPTDTQIAALAQGYTGNPYARTNGLSLRDNPNLLYQKMAGSSNKDTDYRFKVVPHNNAANADAPEAECAPLRLTLDSRTVTASEDPQHADYEFDSWNGHAVGVRLETGALTASTTDLSIATYGPSAEISRTYISSETSAGLYAPGWFFNFEQNLVIGASQIVYTDALRQTHTFTGSGSSWSAPNGFLATLAPDSSNWKLTFDGGESLIFDSAGKLIQIKDDHANTTAYTWTSGKVTTITAANGQTIALTYSGAKLASASYTTAAGTRAVTYTTASPWSITSYPSTACTSTLTYGYDASTRLASITQGDWPAAGTSVAESFLYTSGKLTELRFADYTAVSGYFSAKADARATITYGTDQATINRYGTVGGTANQAMNREVLSWRGASAGVPYQLVSRASGISLTKTETYSYAFDRQPAGTAVSTGGLSAGSIDLNHDLVSTTETTGSLQSLNQTTDYGHDSQHRVTSEKAYQSATVYALTTNTYTGADLTASQTADQTGTVLSASTFTSDTAGRQTQEKKLITGTPSSGTWTQTDTSNFAANGEPQTTIARNVKLSSSANPQDLTQTRSYDAFGNLLTETDWSNSRVTATNTYDIAGRQLTSTDAASVVSHTAYDCMGNATETYTTAPNTQVKANWSATTFDAMGRELSVTTKLSDTSGNPTTASVVTHTYDGAGNELSGNDNTLGGLDGASTYDAQANTTEQRQEGVRNPAPAGATTRSVYDESGNVLFESAPGNTNTPGPSTACSATTYDDVGNALSSREPDGNITVKSYSGQGIEVATEGTTSIGSSGYTEWNSGVTVNAAGQTLSATDPQQSHLGLTTTNGLDLLGRTTAATAERDTGSEPATQTTYNDLGWVLQSTDANGVTTSNTYDTHGQLASKTIGSKTSSQTYNAASGRLSSTQDNDGTTATYTYDAFGNATRVLEEASGGADRKDTNTTFDSLGRPGTVTEAVAGTQRTYTYPVNTASGVQETLSYGASAATSLSVTRNARNMETTRTATIASGTTVTRSTTDDATGRDAADRWTSASVQLSGRSAKTQSRSFDNADHMTSQSGLGFTSGQSAAYTYDATTGKKSAAALPLSFGGAIADGYLYYPGGRLSQATTNGTTASYSFDEVGNLIGDVITDGRSEKLIYDTASRLIESQLTGPEEDAQPVSTYYGWDTANAWRTSQGTQADPGTHEIDLTYNALGRMSTYSSPTTSATYTYDATGQRTQSVVTPSGGTAATTTYAYDGLTLLKLSATQGSDSWKIEYLHNEDDRPYGGVYRSPSSSTSPTYFSLITNDHGDVLELTDADGAAFASYRYDAWGSPVSSSTQATSLITSTLAGQIASRQILRYASYTYDSESGFYYCSARYYDSATRQWTTGDPAKADGEESAYQYCGGEPVSRTDPTGLHYPCSVTTKRSDAQSRVRVVLVAEYNETKVQGSSDVYGVQLTRFKAKAVRLKSGMKLTKLETHYLAYAQRRTDHDGTRTWRDLHQHEETFTQNWPANGTSYPYYPEASEHYDVYHDSAAHPFATAKLYWKNANGATMTPVVALWDWAGQP